MTEQIQSGTLKEITSYCYVDYFYFHSHIFVVSLLPYTKDVSRPTKFLRKASFPVTTRYMNNFQGLMAHHENLSCGSGVFTSKNVTFYLALN